MTSDPQETVVDLDEPLADETPEADAVEQHQSPVGHDTRDVGSTDLPIEADPADVQEQRRSVDDAGEDDYR